MPEAEVVDTPAVTDAAPPPESLGWRAGLPGDLQQNPELATFKTVGDFAKDDLAIRGKVKDLETKLGNAVPKLQDNATPEERGNYLNALGRPPKASEYEFDGEDKNAPEWTGYWKEQFHGLGFTKDQAKQLSGLWNTQMQKMVEAHNNAIKAETSIAETKLRSEMGDKYDTNVELAKRLWQKHGEGDFDKSFGNDTGANRFATIRMILKFAALTGEDVSPQGGQNGSPAPAQEGFAYTKSPPPPTR